MGDTDEVLPETPIQAAARRMCQESLAREPGVVPPPSSSLAHIHPPLSHEEYEELESDRSKYFLYLDAIRIAIRQLVGAGDDGDAAGLRVLVLGAGHGRLVTMALDAARSEGCHGVRLDAVDVNPEAVRFLREHFAGDGRVCVHPAVCINAGPLPATAPTSVLALQGACDLIVSELFGSFGDNEFLPEVCRAACRAFGSERVLSIPQSWESHVQLFASEYLRGHVSAERMYVTSLPLDGRVLSRSHRVYAGECVAQNAGTRHGACPPSGQEALFCADGHVKMSVDCAEEAAAVADGALGYFTARLFGDTFIDTRHASPGYNCFHWQAFFFPFQEPLRVCRGDVVEFGIRRRCVEETVLRDDRSDVGAMVERGPSCQAQGDVGARPAGRAELESGCAESAGHRKRARSSNTSSTGRVGGPILRMWYEWRARVEGRADGDGLSAGEKLWSNAGGRAHSLWLSSHPPNHEKR